MTEKDKKKIALVGIITFVLLSIAAFLFIGKPMLRFIDEPESFRDWVNGNGVFGWLAFLGMQILQVFVAIIPGEPLEIGAGYAFGALEGTILCLVGTVIGSILVFAFVRRFGTKAIEVFFAKKDINSLSFLKDSKKLSFVIFLLFFIPGTPKDLLTYFAGLTKIRLRDFILLTTIARIPSVITSTIGGNALGLKNYVFAIIVFAATLVISGIGVLVYKKYCLAHAKSESSESGQDNKNEHCCSNNKSHLK